MLPMAIARASEGAWRYLDALAGLDGSGLTRDQQSTLRSALRSSNRDATRLRATLTPEHRAESAARREQNMALGRAIHANDAAGVRAAIAAGATAEIDAAAEGLGLAIARDWRDVARALVDGGARVHPTYVRYWLGGDSSSQEAPDAAAAARALDFGLDPNEPDMSGDGMRTALMRAVEAGDVDLTRRMLALGGRFVDSDALATTYLNAAAASGVAAMVDLVLASHPEPRRTSQFGETPLHEVAFGPVANLVEPSRRDVGVDRAAIVATLLKSASTRTYASASRESPASIPRCSSRPIAGRTK